MKKMILLMGAFFAFTVASAQTNKTQEPSTSGPTKEEIKAQEKQVKKDKNSKSDNGTRTDALNEDGGMINPTDTNPEGSNSRNSSRNNTYNKETKK